MGKIVSICYVEKSEVEWFISYRPEYSVFELSADELCKARDLAGRGVIIASWLAIKARNELPCFREFIYWLRYGVCVCGGCRFSSQTNPK